MAAILKLLFRLGESAVGQIAGEQNQALKRKLNVVTIGMADGKDEEIHLPVTGNILSQNSSSSSISLPIRVVVARPEIEDGVHFPDRLVAGKKYIFFLRCWKFGFAVH